MSPDLGGLGCCPDPPWFRVNLGRRSVLSLPEADARWEHGSLLGLAADRS